MANSYYGVTGNPVSQSRGSSSTTRSEFLLIQQGFDKLPSPVSGASSTSNYSIDTGAVNALVCTLNSNVSAYTDGMELVVKVAATNTGAATILPGTLTVKNIVRLDGSALQANDLLAGEIVELRYNATSGNFQLLQLSPSTLTTAVSAASASATAAASSASAAAAAATSLTSTSTTSLLISVASKSFTTQTGKAYVAGYQFVTLVSNANSANYMLGMVTAYNSSTGAMTINVLAIGGSGTFADWNIAVSGSQGVAGPAGTVASTTRQTLTDQASITWDWSAGRIAVVTLGGNRTVAAPTNLVTDTCIFEVVQDATGSRTLAWNAIFIFPEGVLPTLSTVAGRRDLFSGFYNGTNIIMSYLRGVR